MNKFLAILLVATAGFALAYAVCPCEEELIDVSVEVNSPNNRAVALDVYKNVYTSASTFMKKQGMELRTFGSEAHFIEDDPEAPCYRGVVRAGRYKLKDGIGLATIAFRLTTSETHLTATVCACAAPDALGLSVCDRLGENLEERLQFVKQKLESGGKDAKPKEKEEAAEGGDEAEEKKES